MVDLSMAMLNNQMVNKAQIERFISTKMIERCRGSYLRVMRCDEGQANLLHFFLSMSRTNTVVLSFLVLSD